MQLFDVFPCLPEELSMTGTLAVVDGWSLVGLVHRETAFFNFNYHAFQLVFDDSHNG